MRFVAAVALIGTLPIVSCFVTQGSTRRALVSAPTPRQWTRFAEKQEYDDSEVMIDEANEVDEFVDDAIIIEESSSSSPSSSLEEEEEEIVKEEVEVVKDAQTLFDEANMQKAIQLVIDR